MLEMSFSAEGR